MFGKNNLVSPTYHYNEKQKMLDASSKTWATRYHPVYIPMPRWYGKEEYTGF